MTHPGVARYILDIHTLSWCGWFCLLPSLCGETPALLSPDKLKIDSLPPTPLVMEYENWHYLVVETKSNGGHLKACSACLFEGQPERSLGPGS
ncbi:hypothetical protein CPSG_06250 [Coccidioides posadasii str. Silveira]|uniref:Uncharacterized protein n=1 Tax=Coccidioides posadasii (strain RMSCC 757 / Silveira) TaxID=443226 RepID=E9D8U8_COCPS|nr:hypothetical protein CPSG_06250 [Coccidioides posadasii str. Silveira]